MWPFKKKEPKKDTKKWFPICDKTDCYTYRKVLAVQHPTIYLMWTRTEADKKYVESSTGLLYCLCCKHFKGADLYHIIPDEQPPQDSKAS